MANKKISDLPYRTGNALGDLDLIEVSEWSDSNQTYSSTKLSAIDLKTFLQPLTLHPFTFTPPDTMTSGGTYSLSGWFGNPSDIYKAFDGDLSTWTTHNKDGWGAHTSHGLIAGAQTGRLSINLGSIKTGKIYVSAFVRNDDAISSSDRVLVSLESDGLLSGGTQSAYGNGYNIGTLYGINGFNYTMITLTCSFWGQNIGVAFANEGSTATGVIREIQIYV